MNIKIFRKLKLFKRGKLISATPIIIGKNQFPKPPIAIGITIKKIINIACAVTTTLYECSPKKKDPLFLNSKRIKLESLVPTKPPHLPTIIYKLPISL